LTLRVRRRFATRLEIIKPGARNIEAKPAKNVAGKPVEGSEGFVTVVTDCWLVVEEGVELELVDEGEVVEVGVTH
jgi:hypothetical protein